MCLFFKRRPITEHALESYKFQVARYGIDDYDHLRAGWDGGGFSTFCGFGIQVDWRMLTLILPEMPPKPGPPLGPGDALRMKVVR